MPNVDDNVHFTEVGMVGMVTFNMIALFFQIMGIYPLLVVVSSVHSALGHSCRLKQENKKKQMTCCNILHAHTNAY